MKLPLNAGAKSRAALGKMSRLKAVRGFNEHVLHPLARPSENQGATHAPIFIVGPPRAGSTLLYQLLTACYDTGYISNLHCALYGAPHWVESFTASRNYHSPREFRSDTGQTEGLKGPCECNAFWYLFFPKSPCYVESISPEKRRDLIATIRGFIRASGRPVVFKTQYHSMRLLPLAEAFPDAVFLVTLRDEVDTGHSLLELRWRRSGNYNDWMFYETPNIDAIRQTSPARQVIEYVRTTESIIREHSAQIGRERFHWVQYEKLCADPIASLNETLAFLGSHQIPMKQIADIPPGFQPRKVVRIDEKIYKEMVDFAAAAAVK